MARNKHPEQTIQKILMASMRLFAEKGYEKTTIQDIVNSVGMSKGAIYHHFKNKEEILNELGTQFYHDQQGFANAIQNSNKTGLENIRELIHSQISNNDKVEMDAVMINIWNDPKFFMISMQENMVTSSVIIETLIKQGIEDGSIQAQDAHSASQVLILLINYWVLSPITDRHEQGIKQRIQYFSDLCNALGIPIINDELKEQLTNYFFTLSKSLQ